MAELSMTELFSGGTAALVGSEEPRVGLRVADTTEKFD